MITAVPLSHGTGPDFWKSPVKIVLRAAHGQKSKMSVLTHVCPGKLISQPHNELLPVLPMERTPCSITQSTRHTVGAAVIIPTFQMTELRPKGLHHLLNTRQIGNGKVIIGDSRVCPQMAELVHHHAAASHAAPCALSPSTQPSLPPRCRPCLMGHSSGCCSLGLIWLTSPGGCGLESRNHT